jgi:hypothetical protein
MEVINWIWGQSSRYKPFVAHRVGEIKEKTSPTQWRHVPKVVNPADLATRGEKMENLIGENPWTDGPAFLYKEEKDWPAPRNPVNLELLEVAQVEVTKAQAHVRTILETPSSDSKLRSQPTFPIDCSDYSSWNRLVRVTAWVLRFVNLMKPGNRIRKQIMPTLNVPEIEAAEKVLNLEAQRQGFRDTIQNLKNDKSSPSGPLRER